MQALLLTLTMLCAASVQAAGGSVRMSAQVLDLKGKPVENALVFVYEMKDTEFKPPTEPYVMDTVDQEFVPRLLPIQVGGTVTFPNKDNIHHHVYSFSKSKSFDLPLYKGKAASPVTFDKEGLVKVGCNIHDWMRGIILVVPTPYFARTDAEGNATLNVPRGFDLEFAVYHERLRGGVDKTKKTVKLSRSKAKAKWKIKLKRRRSKRPKAGYK
jgi:plastocyanin